MSLNWMKLNKHLRKMLIQFHPVQLALRLSGGPDDLSDTLPLSLSRLSPGLLLEKISFIPGIATSLLIVTEIVIV